VEKVDSLQRGQKDRGNITFEKEQGNGPGHRGKRESMVGQSEGNLKRTWNEDCQEKKIEAYGAVLGHLGSNEYADGWNVPCEE